MNAVELLHEDGQKTNQKKTKTSDTYTLEKFKKGKKSLHTLIKNYVL